MVHLIEDILHFLSQWAYILLLNEFQVLLLGVIMTLNAIDNPILQLVLLLLKSFLEEVKHLLNVLFLQFIELFV